MSVRKPPTETFDDLRAIVSELRTECPWDRKQTHESLAPHTLEEAYETIEAIEDGDDQALVGELGDMLLHVLMHAEIADGRNAFDFSAIVRNVAEKLVRRHPHVYGTTEVGDAEAVAKNWEETKLAEGRTSLFDGMPRGLPALQRAERVQQKAHAVGFDWPEIGGVWDKLDEELGELRTEIEAEAPETSRIEAELGDLLFTVVNLARFLRVTPERGLKGTTDRFIARFRRVEQSAADQGRAIADFELAELEELWQQAKREEAKA